MISWRRAVLYLAALALLVAPLYILSLIVNCSHLPTRDYWGALPMIFDSDTGEVADLARWTRLHDGQQILIPKIIYYANVSLWGGSSRYLSLWAFAMAFVQMIVLIAALPKAVQADRSLQFLLALVLSLMCFTPQAAEMWNWGWAAVLWTTANLFAILALLATRNYLQDRRAFPLIQDFRFGSSDGTSLHPHPAKRNHFSTRKRRRLRRDRSSPLLAPHGG